MKIKKSVSKVATKAVVAKGKQVKPATPVVVKPEVAKGKGKQTVLVAIGLRGVVLSSGVLFSDGSYSPSRDHNGTIQEFAARPAKLGESVPAVWKGAGGESLWGKAVGAYVSPAGESFKLLTLDRALETKAVRKETFLANGSKAECFVPSGWTEKMQFPQYIGTASPLGRFEPKLHPNGAARQGGAHAKLELVPTKAAPKAKGTK